MSRPTDTERGANIALHTAINAQMQGELWPGPISAAYWAEIEYQARMQLLDFSLERQALRGAA